MGGGVTAIIERIARYLEGWPDGVLTLALLLAALVLVLIALHGRALDKAVALTYVIVP